ncbi:DAHP synthetase [Piptocephalis cylindrospora]|uniref:Phospho-2-dehydro-3-deoxyheptonate aldolase n=1 Tax=Piptocephalis cylindrospora TaxID=1907219 RepID=A0A4P9Y290_9FUNG|nr:DAHP synthetase [Piptocephalis cylindrospora]|eukprot:RKP12171.1 DAHP synthetase [Piptocephalis cylindrospora]
MSAWTPNSWKEKPIRQDVTYEDPTAVDRAVKKLEHLPPLVTPGEIRRLREQLKQVSRGESFLLQGGDCAELFDYCSQDPIESKLKVLLQMSLVLTWGARTPVVRIARMAGQYAKPRSSSTEKYGDKMIPSFRGDNVNGYDPEDRNPDPERLVSAYFHSAATLNYVRGLLSSGFADLHHPFSWDLQHVRSSAIREEYQGMANRITDALQFMSTIGADQTGSTAHPMASALNTVDLFMSHEGLLLEYESALTRKDQDKWYNTSGHFLWIGDRTRALNEAHVEYFRGLENPIGVKCGPSMDPKDLGPLLDILDPNKEDGKVTLISRYGADKIDDYLPAHIQAVKASGHRVVWACDPMHGNTETSQSGLKTRQFDRIITELGKAFRIHKDHDKCVGGSMELEDDDLRTNYQTHCDPRLNYEQSLDVAYLISGYYEKQRKGFQGL